MNNKEDKNSIAYCGLYCGDCSIYKGKIADLARDLRKELREEKDTAIREDDKNGKYNLALGC